MKEHVEKYIKTEKAQEQEAFGNKMKYHFHITTYSTSVVCPLVVLILNLLSAYLLSCCSLDNILVLYFDC